VIERVASDALRVYPHHIPRFFQVPITFNLIEMLRKQYPDTVVGAKDSSGVWSNTPAIIDSFAKDGFDLFSASESTLLKALPPGAAGCISATVNVNPAAIHAVYAGWQTRGGAALQAKVNPIRQIFYAMPMIPAMKRTVAAYSGDAAWKTVARHCASLTTAICYK